MSPPAIDESNMSSSDDARGTIEPPAARHRCVILAPPRLNDDGDVAAAAAAAAAASLSMSSAAAALEVGACVGQIIGLFDGNGGDRGRDAEQSIIDVEDERGETRKPVPGWKPHAAALGGEA